LIQIYEETGNIYIADILERAVVINVIKIGRYDAGQR
jgi:hypothetical protein